MPANFQHFVHEEEVYGREEWSIDLGNSNAALFTQLFGHMFDDVRVLQKNDDPKDLPIDALIEPSIDAFEFSVPNQSKTDSFAVWIRYRLKIYDRDGTLVSNWPVETTSAQALTTDLFRRQAADASLNRAQALRRTMLDLIDHRGMIDDKGRMVFSYAHPIFWAPFSLVGDAGGGRPAE